MDVVGMCLSLVFMTNVRAYQDPLVVQRATDEEAREVQEVSDAFERRMRETRNVALLKDLFLDDFMRLRIKEIYPNGPVSLFESIPLSLRGDLATQVSQNDWEKFYAARLNLRYYLVLLIVSRLDPNDLKEPDESWMRENFIHPKFSACSSVTHSSKEIMDSNTITQSTRSKHSTTSNH